MHGDEAAIKKAASNLPRWMRGAEGRSRQSHAIKLINTMPNILNSSQRVALKKGLMSTLSLWQG